MIEFETNYTEKFINITPYNNFNHQLVNQYGPWVATVDIKADVDLLIASPKMAKYMMGRAKELHEEINMYHCNPSSWVDEDIKKDTINELQTILSILKDAGVEVVEK